VMRDGKCVWDHWLKNDVLCGPDLDSALSRGVLSEVSEVAGYEGAGMFVEWAKRTFELRDRYAARGDAIDSCIAKTLSVALWGAFAARTHRWEPYDACPPPGSAYGPFVHHPVNGEPKQCRAIAGVVDSLEERTEPDDSIPSVAAFVAAYTRMYMDNLIAIAGASTLLYQCADELHVTYEGYCRLRDAGLIDSHQPGKLKYKRTVIDPYYHAPNVYCHDGEWTFAGRLVGAQETSPRTWEWDSVEPIKSAILTPPTGRVATAHHKVSLGD
jgi:hypothetical protein